MQLAWKLGNFEYLSSMRMSIVHMILLANTATAAPLQEYVPSSVGMIMVPRSCAVSTYRLHWLVLQLQQPYILSE